MEQEHQLHPSLEAFVDDRRVYESGCLIAPAEESVKFQFQTTGTPLVLQIKFETDRAPRTDIRISEGKTEGSSFLVISVVNGLSADGAGTKDPILIGTLDDAPLFLSFWVSPLGHSNALLQYTCAGADGSVLSEDVWWYRPEEKHRCVARHGASRCADDTTDGAR